MRIRGPVVQKIFQPASGILVDPAFHLKIQQLFCGVPVWPTGHFRDEVSVETARWHDSCVSTGPTALSDGGKE